MAYIRKRDGRFQVLVRVNGRERSAGTFGRKLDAERARRTVEDARERNTRFDPRAGDVLVGEWVRVWLATKHDVKPKTMNGYEARRETEDNERVRGPSPVQSRPDSG
jgi:hypothetical protein